jgi:cell division protein FtsL
MNPFGFFDRRVRGFRVVEVGALGVLLVLILAVYLAKTGAGGKRADIDRIQAQIFDEQTQIRLLRAEVATLEQPQRLEALATRYLGLQPISVRREVTPEALQDVAQVAVVNSKTVVVPNDPLTQKGSPDLPAADAPPAPAAPLDPIEALATPAAAPAATLQPVALKPAPTPATRTAGGKAPTAAHHAPDAKIADAAPPKLQPAALKHPAAAAKAPAIKIARADAASHTGPTSAAAESVSDVPAPAADAPASTH